MKYDVAITRHKDLLALLEEDGVIDSSTPRIEHTDNIDDVRNMNVIGVLPAKLAIFAKTVTECQLDIPRELRGTEMPLKQLRGFAGPLQTFKVEQIPTRSDFSDVVLTTLATTFIQYVIRQGIILRGSPTHQEAVARNGSVSRELIENRPVMGHLPYWLGQYTLDVSTIGLYYEFERRGKVHTYEEMSSYAPQLFTYKVKKLAQS